MFSLTYIYGHGHSAQPWLGVALGTVLFFFGLQRLFRPGTRTLPDKSNRAQSGPATAPLLSLGAIVQALRQAGHLSVAEELQVREAQAATGGERVDAVSSRLLGLKVQYPHVYDLIQPEADAWLAAGRQGGVIIPTYPEGGYE